MFDDYYTHLRNTTLKFIDRFILEFGICTKLCFNDQSNPTTFVSNKHFINTGVKCVQVFVQIKLEKYFK